MKKIYVNFIALCSLYTLEAMRIIRNPAHPELSAKLFQSLIKDDMEKGGMYPIMNLTESIPITSNDEKFLKENKPDQRKLIEKTLGKKGGDYLSITLKKYLDMEHSVYFSEENGEIKFNFPVLFHPELLSGAEFAKIEAIHSSRSLGKQPAQEENSGEIVINRSNASDDILMEEYIDARKTKTKKPISTWQKRLEEIQTSEKQP